MLDIKPDFTDLAHRRRHQRALARSQSKGSAAAHSELEKMASGEEGSNGPPLADAGFCRNKPALVTCRRF